VEAANAISVRVYGTSVWKPFTSEAIDYLVTNGLNIGRAGLSSVNQIE
jgi:hypothetical protein